LPDRYSPAGGVSLGPRGARPRAAAHRTVRSPRSFSPHVPGTHQARSGVRGGRDPGVGRSEGRSQESGVRSQESEFISNSEFIIILTMALSLPPKLDPAPPTVLELKLAHSPDSDDAFMFYGLATR